MKRLTPEGHAQQELELNRIALRRQAFACQVLEELALSRVAGERRLRLARHLHLEAIHLESGAYGSSSAMKMGQNSQNRPKKAEEKVRGPAFPCETQHFPILHPLACLGGRFRKGVSSGWSLRSMPQSKLLGAPAG